MQNSLYKDVLYEKNQAANSNSSAGRFCISSIKDLLCNSRKKSLIVHSLPFLAIIALGVPINPIPELFSTIKIVRKFLMMNLQCLFPKKRFWQLFTTGYLFFHLFLDLCQNACSAEFPQHWFHFSCLCVAGVLWRSKAIWWWLWHIKLRSSELGA